MGSSSARSVPPPSPVAHGAQQAAANDAAQPRPTIVLSEAQHARLRKAALALAAVKPLPAYVDARVRHMGAIHATARRDREALTAIDLGDRSLSARDIDDLGARVQFVRELLARREVRSITLDLADPTRLADAELMSAMWAHRRRLCTALMLRFSGSPEKLKEVRAIRNNRRASDHERCNLALFALLKNPPLGQWLRALPRGEGAALDALTALHAEWTLRDGAASTPDAPVESADLVQRAYALACELLARIVTVGRYLVADLPERSGDYAGFTRPKRAARPPKVAPPVASTPKPA